MSRVTSARRPAARRTAKEPEAATGPRPASGSVASARASAPARVGRATAAAPARIAGSRVARRRALQREQILALAAQHFAARGLDAVRLDDIADSADVARGTLYSHFASKEALVSAIVRPALELAAREVQEIGACRARVAIDRVVALYLRLWREHGEALRVSHRLGRMPPGELAALHSAFVTGLVRALRPAATAGILRVREPELAVLVVARVAVPLLELYAARPDGERLFSDSLRGLLVAD